jgi:hypothetical protein
MPFLYNRFLNEQSESEKFSIRERILAHNRDDLNALWLVWDRIKRIVEEHALGSTKTNDKH